MGSECECTNVCALFTKVRLSGALPVRSDEMRA